MDYQRQRFTMDDAYVRAVMRFFVHLSSEAGSFATTGSSTGAPDCRTSISDLEVEHRDVDDALTYVRYPLADGDRLGDVATARPATILADVAVAVHPDDERYKHLLDEDVIVPVVGPARAGDRRRAVEPAFGTGALKITPGHDPLDFEIGRDHKLPERR